MKVLVIPTWFPNGADKLMGVYHKEFTQALNNHKISANMLYVDRQRLNNPIHYLFMKKTELLQEENYQVYIQRMLNYAPISFDLQMKSYTKKMEKAFKRYLKDHEKPDILHAHVTVPAGYAAVKIGKKYHIPVVVTEHCGDLERFFNKEPFQKYGLYTLENSTYSVVSEYMKEIVLKYKKECFVLPNTVNVSLFYNDKKRKIDQDFRLVVVCALREGKKIDILLEAIKKVRNQLSVHLDIIGSGFLEDYYKKVCHDLNLDDIVTFLGQKNKKEIASILEQEHALVISSDLESFAIPGIEALASGLPVIATDCLGPRMYINKDTGLLCKVNDSHDMAESILKMAKNYHQYDSKKLREMANIFSEDEVIKKAKQIYEEALKNNES